MTHRKRLGILVGGGPAPGINSVIGAATIRALLEDVEVLGIEDGFEWLMEGNIDHANIQWGKAGRMRWKGQMPHNRGVTMNPVDHPMGGGEGRSSGGRHPCSPWGQLSKGLKTRNNKRTDGMIIKRRGQKG